MVFVPSALDTRPSVFHQRWTNVLASSAKLAANEEKDIPLAKPSSMMTTFCQHIDKNKNNCLWTQNLRQEPQIKKESLKLLARRPGTQVTICITNAKHLTRRPRSFTRPLGGNSGKRT